MTRPTDAVRSAVRDALPAALPQAGGMALVACSGGADSLALAAGAAQAVGGRPWRVGAVVVDHQLQPGSRVAAEAAAGQCRGLGLDPVLICGIEVTGSGGPEASARRARYRALASSALQEGADAVLLGHSLDDQAETVLLGLARGSGSRSLAGMPARTTLSGTTDVVQLRPLLGLPRDVLRAACREWGLRPWEDPHNRDRAYTRIRVRRDVMPALAEALGPGVPQALARTASLLRDDEEALSAIAADALAAAEEGHEPGQGLDRQVLAGCPPAVRRRALRAAVLAEGVPPGALKAEHLLAMDRVVVSGSGLVRLPGGVEAGVRCGRLVLHATGG